MNPISELKDLSIGYKKNQPILTNINLSLFEGEIVSLIGANGSGKSTLVRTWTGLIPKIGGEISIARNLKLSLVPQFKNINFSFPLKVKDVILQPQNSKLFFAKKEFTKEEFEILKTFRIHKILNSMIAECSGGQLQKILICRSLFSEAKLIFLDEPLDALDEKSTWLSLEILKKSAKLNKKTFFIITHNIDKEFISNFNKIFQVKDNTIIQIL